MNVNRQRPTPVPQEERLLSNTLPSALGGERYLMNEHHVPVSDKCSRVVIKDAMLEADGHRCRRCGATENLEMDHIKPIHQGGERTSENRQTLCYECHHLKTYYEGWIKAKPASRLLGPLVPQATGPVYYYVATGVWNATRGRWEQYGPFFSYEEAWEWVENKWLNRPIAP
jgi:hypothetical protein